MNQADSQRSLWAILIGFMAKGALTWHIVDHDGDSLVYGLAEWMIFLLFYMAAMHGHRLFDLHGRHSDIHDSHGRSK